MPKFTSENARAMGSKGGQTTYQRHGRAHMQKIGRIGFMTTVKRHYGGDARRYVNELIGKGLQRMDPAPWNGAWQPRADGSFPDRLPADWTPGGKVAE
jgi:hypothetical protein